MDSKQLKKVFEFIGTMLENETDVSEAKIAPISSFEPSISNIEQLYDNNLPESFKNLIEKYNLDISHIRGLIKTLEIEAAKEAIKNSKINELATLQQEIKKLKKMHEDELLTLKNSESINTPKNEVSSPMFNIENLTDYIDTTNNTFTQMLHPQISYPQTNTEESLLKENSNNVLSNESQPNESQPNESQPNESHSNGQTDYDNYFIDASLTD